MKSFTLGGKSSKHILGKTNIHISLNFNSLLYYFINKHKPKTLLDILTVTPADKRPVN